MPGQLPTLSIFVSSTWNDLRQERRAIIEALNRLRLMKFVGMEYSGAWSESPLYPSLTEARECDAYIGIFGGRYGSGITAEEYRAARSEGRPCFIYFKDESLTELEVDAELEKRAQLKAFKEELLLHHTCEFFTTPEDLAAKITAHLSNWYEREFLPRWADEASRKRIPTFAPCQLPPAPIDFVGRQQEIEVLMKALEPSDGVSVAGISGMGGVGKTALSLLVAEKLREDYPQGQLDVELHSMRHEPLDLAEALKRCIEHLGVGRIGLPDNVNELSKIYRHNLSGKRVLVVLDDATTESQVRAFMPPTGCALLVTSREKLVVPGITNIRLAPLGIFDACSLLRRIASCIGPGEAEQIAGLCGYLPLALRAAASLLDITEDLSPSAYALQLQDEQTRLKALDRKAERILEVGVEATFNISYERLGSEARCVFRCLAVFPSTFDSSAQEAVCRDTSGEYLSDLVRLSLVFFDDRTLRYRLHDLVRLYTSQMILPHERKVVANRHALHYLDVARTIGELYEHEVTTKSGLELFDTEWANLQTGRAWMGEHSMGDDDAALSCLHYADSLKQLLYLRRHTQEQISWIESALAASRQLKQRVTEGRYLCHLGTAYSLTEPRRAVGYYRQAIEIARETEDHLGIGNALGSLGNTYARLGQDRLAIECYEQCLLQLYELSDGRGAGRTLTNLGKIYASRGESRHAIEFYGQALDVAREMHDRRGEATALCNVADEKATSGESDAAAAYYHEALSIMKEIDDLRGQAAALTGLGNIHSASDEHDHAFDCYREALSISRELGDSSGEEVALGSIGNQYAALGKFDEAIKCHEQALGISRELGDRRSEIQDLTNLGDVYYRSNDTKSALTFHFEALSISREIGSELYEGIALFNIALVFYKSGEKERAGIYAAAAFEILKKLGHPLAESVRELLTRRRG